MDFSKCQCANAGWCKIFNKEMTYDPPNWQWCQSLSVNEREEYYHSLHKSYAGKVLKKSNDKYQVDIINFYDNLPEKQNNHAICVIAANDLAMSLLDITRNNIKQYANKCNADYIELSGDQSPNWPLANKYRLIQVVEKYTKTLYLDCDVFIQDDAPNIFDLTPNDKISAYDEYEIWIEKDSIEWIHSQQETIIHKDVCPELKIKYIHSGYFQAPRKMLNGGVLVIPQALAHYYQQPKACYPKQWCFDQNLLTLLLPDDKFFNLSFKFNCLYSSPSFYCNLKNSYFLHINNLKDEEKRKQYLQNPVPHDKIKEELVLHEDISTSTRFHVCNAAKNNQYKYNQRLIKIIERQENINKFSLDNVCILCLGHADSQFKQIQQRNYLKPVNLNNIKAGNYAGNEWAEARAFISEESLFPESAEFYGFVTASWNSKYENEKIDNFHNWFSSKILLNSKPEDKIYLCADMWCYCHWIQSEYNIIDAILRKKTGRPYRAELPKRIGKNFIKLMKFDKKNHRYVPYSNQAIYHKSIYFEYKRFLELNDCFEKIKWFVKKYNLTNIDIRINAYFMELLNIMWLSNNDFNFICNTHRKINWYDKTKERGW